MRLSLRPLLFACLALPLLAPAPGFAASVLVKGNGVTSFQIRNTAGQVVASGKTGITVQLAVGSYVFAIGAATKNITVSNAGSNQVVTYPIWVKGSKGTPFRVTTTGGAFVTEGGTGQRVDVLYERYIVEQGAKKVNVIITSAAEAVIGTGPITVTGTSQTPFTVKLRTGGGTVYTTRTGQSSQPMVFDLMMDTYDLVMGPAKTGVTLNSANLSATVNTGAITTASGSGTFTVRDYAQTGVVATGSMGGKIDTWQGSYKVELPGNRRVTANVYPGQTTTAN